MEFLLYPLLTTALYYLGARAALTRWLWSGYPNWLDSFMVCAACSGFWYGAAVAAFGEWAGIHGIVVTPWVPLTVITTGLASMVWTPLFAWLHLSALARLEPPPDSLEEE